LTRPTITGKQAVKSPDRHGAHLERHLGWLAFSAFVVILVIDRALSREGIGVVRMGVLDETAHVCTALLLAAVAPPFVLRYGLPIALGAVILDLDHLPGVLGSDMLAKGVNRPYSHSLLTLIIVLLIALALSPTWRRATLAITFALATHLFRDLATGKVPLLWPASDHGFNLPYRAYALTLAVATAAIVGRQVWRMIKPRPAQPG
jgi:hypothetical protein